MARSSRSLVLLSGFALALALLDLALPGPPGCSRLVARRLSRVRGKVPPQHDVRAEARDAQAGQDGDQTKRRRRPQAPIERVSDPGRGEQGDADHDRDLETDDKEVAAEATRIALG